jgi:hypothetical protein
MTTTNDDHFDEMMDDIEASESVPENTLGLCKTLYRLTRAHYAYLVGWPEPYSLDLALFHLRGWYDSSDAEDQEYFSDIKLSVETTLVSARKNHPL